MRVSVIIPTYNEAQSIGLVLADIPVGLVEQVLVVDSDSTDGTAKIAQQMGAEVLHEPRRGYGRACLTGLAAANAPDVVVFLDGDYSDRPAEMWRLLEPLRQDAADIVIGSRLGGERMAAPEKLRFGAQQLIYARFSLSSIEPVPLLSVPCKNVRNYFTSGTICAMSHCSIARNLLSI